MKTHLLIITSFLCVTYGGVWSQKATALSKEEVQNTLDGVDFAAALDREFSRIVVGEHADLGSFATLSTSDDIATFAGSIRMGDKSNLNLKAVGGATEGLLPLVTGGETNPNLSLSAKFNIQAYRMRYAKQTFDATTYYDIVYRRKAHQDSLKYDIIRIDEQLLRDTLEMKKIEAMHAENKHKLTQEKAKLVAAKNSHNFQVGDSLETIVAGLIVDSLDSWHQRERLEARMSLQKATDYAAVQKQMRTEKSDCYLEQIEEGFVSLGYKVIWWSVGATYTNRSFYALTDTAAYADQISKRQANNWEFSFSGNHYQLFNGGFIKSSYMSIGIRYTLQDNFDDLTKFTLTDKKELSASPTSRSTSSTKSVYVGDYLRNQSTFGGYIDWFAFLNEGNTFAFHLNPGITSSDRLKTRMNLRVGLVLGVKNPDDEKNMLNAELFCDMADIFKKNTETERFEDRVMVGLNFNFPITFKQTKNR